MDPAVLSAASAILGSAVGGAATIATAWLTQRTQGRRARIEAEIQSRERLYSEFIVEGSKLTIEALDHDLDSPQPLSAVYSVLNRIRLRGSDRVLAAAERSVARIIDQYYRPTLSREELRKTLSHPLEDPLKEFGEACRQELELLLRGA